MAKQVGSVMDIYSEIFKGPMLDSKAETPVWFISIPEDEFDIELEKREQCGYSKGYADGLKDMAKILKA